MSETVTYIIIGVVLFTGSALQALVGFGYGLFAIPVLLVAGLQPQAAIAMVAVAVIFHGVVSLWKMRHERVGREIWVMVAIGLVMQPVGTWGLGKLTEHLDKAAIGQVFGGLLLASLAVRAWLRPEPREFLAPIWGRLVMVPSGLLSGFSGMSGPPIVLWVMAHKWTSDKMRVTTWTIFTSMAATNVLWLYLRFPNEVPHAAKTGLMFTPIVLLGILPGFWLGDRVSHTTLRRMAIGFLVLVGIYAVFQPIFWPDLGRPALPR